MQNVYEVVFQKNDGAICSSRLFNTIRAARRWQAWLCSRPYIQNAWIYKGGAGGEVVA